MYIPPGMTEAEVVDTIYRVVDTLANRFRFGYHSSEDMKQEGARFACEALNSGKYDESLPLANFLYTHMRNRFINYKRDKYIRNESPCKSCIFFDPRCIKSTNQCAAFTDKQECKKLTDWQSRNATKQSIMRPVDVSLLSDTALEEESDVFETASFDEMRSKIDRELPADLRADYLRMLDGISLPKARRQRVREAILLIVKDVTDET